MAMSASQAESRAPSFASADAVASCAGEPEVRMRWWAHGRTSQRAHRDVRHRTRASKNDAETIGGNMGQLLALALFACPLIAFAATPGSDAAGNVPEVATGGTTNDYP